LYNGSNLHEFSGLIITSAICQIVPHSFRLRYHAVIPTLRNLKECGTLQPKLKMAETMIKPELLTDEFCIKFSDYNGFGGE